MLTIIKQTVFHYNMFDLSEHSADFYVIAALSGGADSVAMLLALNELKAEFGFILTACHVNHNLRGADSNKDEAFARSLCDNIGIPLKIRSVDVKSLQKKHQSIEETARNARYCFFSEICEELGDNARIATAHTASDNAETVLFNLTRGSGLRGLCGIPPVRKNIIRPLINCTRGDVLNFLNERKQDFAIDKTNFDNAYSRNKIRNNVIPELLKINPSLETGISAMCGFLKDDDDFLYALADNGLKEAEIGNNQYKSEVLQKLPRPVMHRAIAKILKQDGVSPSNLKITKIAEILCFPNGKINLCKDKFAVNEKKIFCVKTIHQNYRKKS